MKTNLTPEQIAEIVESALNAACLSIQNDMGQNDGGVAGIFFGGDEEETFRELMTKYVNFEISMAETV